MTNRHNQFLRAGKEPIWYSTSRREEKKGIDRADVVMAIQNVEAAYYRKLTRKKVITVGHMVDIFPSTLTSFPARKLLFVGSDNPSNYHAMSDFVRDQLPILRQRFEGLELIMVGKICRVIGDGSGVIKLGEVEDLTEAYSHADLVLNPLTIGTGLKIKMIEALGYGKPVISTSIGAEGLEDGNGEAFFIADTPDQFVQQLERLFVEPGLYQRMAVAAVEFVKRYNARQVSELSNLFR
jgi:glycosyltransferase involved in cell wall biosynthesis